MCVVDRRILYVVQTTNNTHGRVSARGSPIFFLFCAFPLKIAHTTFFSSFSSTGVMLKMTMIRNTTGQRLASRQMCKSTSMKTGSGLKSQDCTRSSPSGRSSMPMSPPVVSGASSVFAQASRGGPRRISHICLTRQSISTSGPVSASRSRRTR